MLVSEVPRVHIAKADGLAFGEVRGNVARFDVEELAGALPPLTPSAGGVGTAAVFGGNQQALEPILGFADPVG